MVRFQFFPRSRGITKEMQEIIDCFVSADEIRASKQIKSNEMLSIVRPYLEGIGFRVERGKTKEAKINVPVLFGEDNVIDKCFAADAISGDGRIVVEVEAGRAVMNNQFLKDIFQACMMFQVEYLVIAVMNDYASNVGGKNVKHRDYETIKTFLETLYVSSRLTLPLKGILLLGY